MDLPNELILMIMIEDDYRRWRGSIKSVNKEYKSSYKDLFDINDGRPGLWCKKCDQVVGNYRMLEHHQGPYSYIRYNKIGHLNDCQQHLFL